MLLHMPSLLDGRWFFALVRFICSFMVFYILCGVGLDVAFSKCKSRSFVGLAKVMGQVGREFSFQSYFLSMLFLIFFFSFSPFLFNYLKRIDVWGSGASSLAEFNPYPYPLFRSRVVSIFS